jgi:hypothetical protein
MKSTLSYHTNNNNILQELIPQEKLKLNLFKSIGGLSKINTKYHEVNIENKEKKDKKKRK